MYRDVLKIEIGALNAVRARRPQRLPLVLSRSEVQQLLAAIDRLPTEEPYGLMCRLMDGAGLRLMETCRLPMKDIDLERGQLTVCEGKGDQDRYVMLPIATREALVRQRQWRKALHEKGWRSAKVSSPSGNAARFVVAGS